MTVSVVSAGFRQQSGHAVLPVPRMLNSGGCDTKTGVQAMKARRYPESCSVNGLKTSQLSEWQQAGKSSRNTFESQKTEVSGNSQSDLSAMPISIRPPLIAT